MDIRDYLKPYETLKGGEKVSLATIFNWDIHINEILVFRLYSICVFNPKSVFNTGGI